MGGNPEQVTRETKQKGDTVDGTGELNTKLQENEHPRRVSVRDTTAHRRASRSPTMAVVRST